MRTGTLMAAAVAVAAIIGLVGQHHTETSPPIPAAEPHPAARGDLFDSDDPTPPGEASVIKGKVREVIDVAEYTYLRLATPDGEAWAAVSKAKVAVDSDVTVENPTRMEHFASSTLKRTFDVIYFGNLQAAGGVPTGALPPGHPNIGTEPSSPHQHDSASPGTEAAGVPEVKVARAAGKNAHTIAEVFGERGSLAGKPLRIRGQVVKVTPGVLGKTYLRLRDGSSTKPEERELVVTTQAEPKVGDVATFEGTLQTDVDVGIGYKYAVLLGDAQVVAEDAGKAF